MRSHTGDKNLQDVILSSSFSLLLVNLSRNSYPYLPLSPPKSPILPNTHTCPQGQTKHYESWLTLLMFFLLFGIPCLFSLLAQAQNKCSLSYILFSNAPTQHIYIKEAISTIFPGLTLQLPFVYVYVYLLCLLNYEILKVKNYIVFISLIFLNWVICSNNFDYKEITSAISLS